jgi:hypothetical protein
LVVPFIGLPSIFAAVHDVRQLAKFAPDARLVRRQTRGMLLADVGRRDAVSPTELRRQLR